VTAGLTLKEAKIVIENHGAVPASSVSELVVLSDRESRFLIEDAGQILQVVAWIAVSLNKNEL
jgi:hypothetical protein